MRRQSSAKQAVIALAAATLTTASFGPIAAAGIEGGGSSLIRLAELTEEGERIPQPPLDLPEPTRPAPRAPLELAPPAPPAEVEAPVPPAEAEVAIPAEVERPEAEAPREELLIEAGAVLLREGTLQIEPSFDYAHFSSDRIAISGFTIFEAIIIGTLRVDQLERDLLTGALTARYAVTDRIQLDGRVPYVYREDTEILGVATASATERTITGQGIGDIEVGASYQALLERGWIPGTILRLRARLPTGKDPFEIPVERLPGGQLRLREAPTGNGFLGLSAGPTLIYRSDPVVFFTGGGYTMNMERDVGTGGVSRLIDPGDTIDFFAGFNVALSETVSMNMSFSDSYTMATEEADEPQPGTSFHDARLTLGTSIGLGSELSLLVSASAGLSEQSPDFVFTFSVPWTFDLFN